MPNELPISMWAFARERWPARLDVAIWALRATPDLISGRALLRARDRAWRKVKIYEPPMPAGMFQSNFEHFASLVAGLLPKQLPSEPIEWPKYKICCDGIRTKKALYPTVYDAFIYEGGSYVSSVVRSFRFVKPSVIGLPWLEYYEVLALKRGKLFELQQFEQAARDEEAKDTIRRGQILLSWISVKVKRKLMSGEYVITGKLNGAERGKLSVDDLAGLDADIVSGRLYNNCSGLVYGEVVISQAATGPSPQRSDPPGPKPGAPTLKQLIAAHLPDIEARSDCPQGRGRQTWIAGVMAAMPQFERFRQGSIVRTLADWNNET